MHLIAKAERIVRNRRSCDETKQRNSTFSLSPRRWQHAEPWARIKTEAWMLLTKQNLREWREKTSAKKTTTRTSLAPIIAAATATTTIGKIGSAWIARGKWGRPFHRNPSIQSLTEEGFIANLVLQRPSLRFSDRVNSLGRSPGSRSQCARVRVSRRVIVHSNPFKGVRVYTPRGPLRLLYDAIMQLDQILEHFMHWFYCQCV